jgi:hypothetical protein
MDPLLPHHPPYINVYLLLLLLFISFYLRFWRLDLYSSIHLYQTRTSPPPSHVCSISSTHGPCPSMCTTRATTIVGLLQ